MRYCHERKLAFFFPSRTGGVTLTNYFNYWMVPVLNPTVYEWKASDFPEDNSVKVRHIFPKEAEKFIPEIKDYKRYIFFRNPLTRFASMCSKYKQIDPNVTIARIVKYFDNYKNSLFFAPQIKYYDNVELLDFDNYELEVKKIGAMFGRTDFTIYKYNSHPYFKSQLTDEVKDFVKLVYAEDYKLGKEVLGKEY